MSNFTLLSAAAKHALEQQFSTKSVYQGVLLSDFDADAALPVTFLKSEGIDFDFNYFKPAWVGRKLAIQLIGQAAAAGGTLAQAQLILSLPVKASAEFVTAVLEGFSEELPEHSERIVQLRPGSAIVSAVVSGLVVPTDRFLQGWSPAIGDAICVTGELGSAISGLRMLQQIVKPDEPHDKVQANLAEYEEVVRSYLYPEVKSDFRDAIAEAGIELSTCQFISENALASFAMLRSDDAKILIDSGTFPIRNDVFRAAQRCGEDVFDWALKGGEDAEFVFTLSQEQVDALREVFPLFRVVGSIETGTGEIVIIDKNGNASPVLP